MLADDPLLLTEIMFRTSFIRGHQEAATNVGGEEDGHSWQVQTTAELRYSLHYDVQQRRRTRRPES